MRVSLIAAILIAALSVAATAQDFYFRDFETGSLGELIRITRYDDDPTVVTNDATYPLAFPPPSGTQCLRVADGDNSFFGLSSARSIYYIDRTALTVASAEIEAYVWLTNSASTTDFNALIAIEDTDAPGHSGDEHYYRLGLRNVGTDGIILQRFDGAAFSTLGTDSALAGGLTLPGWHRLTIGFDSDTIECFVDGTPAAFNPITDSTIENLTVGVLGFDFSTQNPILADDLRMSAPATLPVELSVITSD